MTPNLFSSQSLISDENLRNFYVKNASERLEQMCNEEAVVNSCQNLRGNLMDEELRCYVINLDSSKTRLNKFETAFQKVNFDIQKISAIDGNLIDIDFLT